MKTNLINLLTEFYLDKEFERTEDCPDEATLYKYVCSCLDKQKMEKVKKHIIECDYCLKKILEIREAEEIETVKEDKELTKKIYQILNNVPQNFIKLKIKQQKDEFSIWSIGESPIFKPIIESLIPTSTVPSYGLSLLMFKQDKILRKTKIGDIDIQIEIVPVSQHELRISFLFTKNKLPQKDAYVKIDDKEFLSSKEGKIDVVLPVKEKYKVQIIPQDTAQFNFDILLTKSQ